jgi:hypothetical protein
VLQLSARSRSHVELIAAQADTHTAMRFLSAASWMIPLLLAACGGAESVASRGGTGFGVDNGADLASCDSVNLTRACTCAGRPGRQVCDGAAYSTCECADGSGGVQLEGNNRTDITFEWQRTEASSELGGCLPGKYEGTFGGIYWSVIATLAPIKDLAIPIANVDLPGEPSGFHFTVEPAQGGETILKMKGQMIGLADLTFPFTAELEGELDCKDKSFQARMYMGTYSVLIDGLVAQRFDGVMSGRYDVGTHTFINGVWDVWEISGTPAGTPAPMLPREFSRDGFGGYGTWSAALPTDLNDPTLTACPTDYACQAGPLGPNKHLCSSLLGAPGCTSATECDSHFPGEQVACLQTSTFSTCIRECKP